VIIFSIIVSRQLVRGLTMGANQVDVQRLAFKSGGGDFIRAANAVVEASPFLLMAVKRAKRNALLLRNK